MGVIMDVLRRFVRDFFEIGIINEVPPPSYEPISFHVDSRSDGFTMRVLSMNIWGLPIAPMVEERTRAIARVFSQEWDVVVFQEVWHRRERNVLIQHAVQAGYCAYHYFKAAVCFPLPLGHNAFCTGLLIFAKYPIVEATYFRFTLSGRVYALHESDFLAAKGVGLVRLLTPVGQIDLYCTHLLANYNYLGAPGPGDRYLAHRAAQAYELTRIIELTSKSGLVVLCGDMNSPSDCLCLRIPRELLQLCDAFADANASSDDGITFASDDNKYSHGEHPMRMDYIMYKNTIEDQHRWHLVSSHVYKQYFDDQRGDSACPVSDHFGVACEFFYGIHPPTALRPKPDTASGPRQEGAIVQSENACSVHSERNALLIDVAPVMKDSPRECLEELLQVIEFGHEKTIERRLAHFRRAMIMIVVLMFLILSGSMLRLHGLLLSNVVPPLLLVYIVLELLLAQVAVTWECGSFAELISQVKLSIYKIDISLSRRHQ